MRGRCGIAGGVMWAAALLCLASALSWDVKAERVELALADGTPVSGTLFRPRRPSAGRMPAVVLVHGIALSQASCAPGLARPLAKQGVLALAIDLPGHGRSGGSLPRSWFVDPLATVKIRARHPEVDTAIDFLTARPDYLGGHGELDIPYMALIGHSLGGWAVTNVGSYRDDVQGVVSIGAAPETVDARRPRNFLIVTGGIDPFCPVEKGLEVIVRAGGAGTTPKSAAWEFPMGTERRLIYVGRANHFTELADSRVTLHALQWTASAFDLRFGNPTPWLLLVIASVVIATAGGLVAVTAALARVAGRSSTVPGDRPFCKVRLALLGAVLTGVVPLTAAAGEVGEVGPVYFAAPSVALMTLVGSACLAVAAGRRRPSPVEAVPASGAFHVAGGLGRDESPRGRVYVVGVGLGLVALALSFVWLGLPWGMTWAELLPTPRRSLLALALWPLLLPGCLGLAVGVQRLAGAGGGMRSRCLSGLTWMAVPLTLLLGQAAFASWRPLFIVPAGLSCLTFVPPLPLWLLPNRPGISLARSLCHAGAAAWLLGCHLPFTHAG